MKTQMRFNNSDIEVLTKQRGAEEGYKVVQLSTICAEEDIPKFNCELKWKKKSAKQHRERLMESPSQREASLHASSST